MTTEDRGSSAGEIAKSALQAGAFTGVSGLAVGSVLGILRSNHPAFFAIFSGLQWFGLGTVFWGSRSALLEVPDSRISQPPRASALAGALSGGVVGALSRGRRNVLPGALVFSALGYAGQRAYSYADGLQSQGASGHYDAPPEAAESRWERLAKSKWMPFAKLEDAEYERRLQEKLLGIDAELGVIEDEIRTLRKQGKE